MTQRPCSGRSVPDSFYLDSDRLLDKFFDKYDLKSGNSYPRRQSRKAYRDKLKEEPRPASSGRREHRNFSPDPRVTGEDILNQLKDQLRKESDMFCYSQPEWNTDMHSRKADDCDDWAQKEFEDMRSRHPVFRMPNWMSEDDDISNLTSRMSQSPHFASMGRRGGPWRERRNSGGSAMSGTSEEDSVDSHNFDRGHHNSPNAIRIPIRIEAEAPPGYEPQQQQQQQQQQQHHQQQQEQQQLPQQRQQQTHNKPEASMGQLNKQPQYASKTTSSIDTVDQGVPRNARCSSAPPDMTGPLHGHRYVSKASIIPHNVNDKSFNASTDFNNVAKPFVPSHKTHETAPILEENISEVQQQNDQEEHAQQQQKNPPQEEQQSYQQEQIPQQPYQQEQIPQQPYHQDYQQQQFPQQSYHEEPQQEWDNSGHKSSVVRNIPIVFEGRHSSAATKGHTSAPSRSPPQTQHFNKHSQRDHTFRDPNFGFGSHGFSTTDPFFKFSGSSQHHPSFEQYEQHPGDQQQQAQHEQPYSQQQPNYQQSQRPQPHQESHSQPQPIPKQKSPEPEPKDLKMDAIASIQASVMELKEKAEKFDGIEKNKEFLYIDEMLTRALLKLDDIDPDGKDDVRQARRTLIKDINNTLSNLEKKVVDASASIGDKSVPLATENTSEQIDNNDGKMEVVEENSSTELKPVEDKTENLCKENVSEDVSENVTDQVPEKIEVDPSANAPVEVKSSDNPQPPPT